MAVEVTTENFEEVLKAKNITVIDFWAPWCGPCKLLGPVMDELYTDNETKNVTIGKVNVEEYGTLAAKYGVRGIPTVLFFKDGVEVSGTKLVGLKSKNEFQSVIDGLLEN